MSKPTSPFKQVRRAFDRAALKRICEMHETEFPEAYGMEVTVDRDMFRGDEYADFHAFKDNGSDILAVAHLDTVVKHERRMCNFIDTAAGPVVYSGALDDRLGAYTILELLPALGLNFDILLTTGEESGQSTGRDFDLPEGKEYKWMIEFDRGGKDVVLYQYEYGRSGEVAVDRVLDSGARVGNGSYSDISYMDHLGIKGFNWGVGYQDYHGPRGHAYLEDYWEMLGYFLKFHEANADVHMPHVATTSTFGSRYSRYGGGLWAQDDDVWSNPDEWDPKWSDEQWDAYCDGGIEAVRALDEDVVEAEVIEVDNELISDDFNLVNRQLMAAPQRDESMA